MRVKLYRTSGKPVFLTDSIKDLYSNLFAIPTYQERTSQRETLDSLYNPKGYEIIQIDSIADLLDIGSQFGELVINTFDRSPEYNFSLEIYDDYRE